MNLISHAYMLNPLLLISEVNKGHIMRKNIIPSFLLDFRLKMHQVPEKSPLFCFSPNRNNKGFVFFKYSTFGYGCQTTTLILWSSILVIYV